MTTPRTSIKGGGGSVKFDADVIAATLTALQQAPGWKDLDYADQAVAESIVLDFGAYTSREEKIAAARVYVEEGALRKLPTVQAAAFRSCIGGRLGLRKPRVVATRRPAAGGRPLLRPPTSRRAGAWSKLGGARRWPLQRRAQRSRNGSSTAVPIRKACAP
jgi:hypothetical protein